MQDSTPKIYLDNNATTPLDPRVYECMHAAFLTHFGNPASVQHAWGWAAEELVNIAREELAGALGCKPQEIVFTSGATESINLALRGILERDGGRLIQSTVEHKAGVDVGKYLASLGCEVLEVGVDRYGMVDLDQLAALLEVPTQLVSIIGANNEIGTIQNFGAIAELCEGTGALLHFDLTQALGKIPFKLSEMGVDLASFSAHKVYGPMGVGALYVQTELQHELQALVVGGGHQRGLRSGTLNVPGIVGFGAAARLISSEFDEVHAHVASLTSQFYEGVCSKFPNVKLNGHATERILGNLSLSFPRVESIKLLSRLASRVALSTSSACLSASKQVSHVLSAIGLDSREIDTTVRVGIGRFNTEQEIELALQEIEAVLN